ncbi:odorant receptor 67c-like [Venturia canescens]|uniref:odorant receptor 67c-like n=1 Tax=Venturia canescens TaxID=32260 RepID=UPI001C9CDA1B|nr:odorant receptor 67c-like [Venturia canescens]
MERTRYFRSANEFNIATNLLSGNIFPLGDEKRSLSFVSLLWVSFVWSVNITYIFSVLSGSLYFAKLTTKEALKRSGAIIALYVEFTIPLINLNLRRSAFRNLIRKYNLILIDSEELKKFVHDTVKPYKKGLKIYTVACFIVTTMWKAEPIFKIFHNDTFTYTDFTIPAYFPGEPFGKKIFAAGVILQILGACFVNFGKISIDVYVGYFIAVLTAQYKYVRMQAAKALSQRDDQLQDELPVFTALQNCVRHHGAVIEISQRLTELLAFHIGAAYLTCIMKFCFLAFGFATFESANVEKASYLVYAFACVVQIFLLCSSIQELFDESTSVTLDAFHENWHARGSAVKKIFCLMELSNQMECRLSSYRIVDLAVPALAVILSKSYSFCLLLLEMN